MVEHHHCWPLGGRAGVLHGVLQRFAAGVEQRGAFFVLPGRDPVEGFGHLDIGLVRGGQKTGVGVLGQLSGGAGDDLGCGVAHRGDGDAATQIDERVAVDVDDDPAAGGRGVHPRAAGQPGGQSGAAPSGQLQ
jgi:hypothetical protein